MLVCVVSLILLMADGTEYVKEYGLQSKVLIRGDKGLSYKIDVSNAPKLKTLPLSNSPYQNLQPYVFADKCYEMLNDTNY